MTANNAYTALMAHMHEAVALSQISGLLGWDQETTMARGSANQRAEWMSALQSSIHAKRTDPKVGEWLAAIDPGELDQVGAANIRVISREYERQSRVPADLAREIARVTSAAQGQWAKARAAGDFAAFQDTLAKVVDLRRQEAAALANGGDLYDALLGEYEPGMQAVELDRLFAGLRCGLVDLRERIGESTVEIPDLQGSFSQDQQMLIARELADAFGYDWNRGRLDLAVHPFSSGSGDDVRITTRVAEQDPFNCFYSTIHEVGHAVYEQNIDPRHGLTVLGTGASMGIHESQSRIFENQLGRSRAFTGFLFQRMQAVFGDFGIPDAETFYHVVNKLRRGYIRTEADEVQYNLHVLLRYDLERALIAGKLDVADLQDCWNQRFEQDFGYAVDRVQNGVLQDVHWPVGLIGYFPTYTLGNIYAGELYASLCADLPTLESDLAKGDTKTALAWLKEKIHHHGGVYEPRELVERAVGHSPSEAPLLEYITRKFSEIYQL
jgi:carboxypeptidase Taq